MSEQITLRQAGPLTLWGVERRSALRYCQSGALKSIRNGKQFYTTRQWVREFNEARANLRNPGHRWGYAMR